MVAAGPWPWPRSRSRAPVACPNRSRSLGKHILAERDIEYLTFSRAADGEAGDDAVYVKQKPDHPPIPTGVGGDVGYPADLWAVGTAGGERRLLVEDIQPLFFDPFSVGCAPPSDRRASYSRRRRRGCISCSGSTSRQVGSTTSASTTGAAAATFSCRRRGDGRSWSARAPADRRTQQLAVSVDGAEVPIPTSGARQLLFVGDHIYFADESRQLVRIDDDGSTSVAADLAMAGNWHGRRHGGGRSARHLPRRRDPRAVGSNGSCSGPDHAGVIDRHRGLLQRAVSRPIAGGLRSTGSPVDVARRAPESVEVLVLTPDETPPEQIWELPPPKVDTLPRRLMPWSGGQVPTRCGRSTAASTRTCTRRCCGRASRPSRWRGPR